MKPKAHQLTFQVNKGEEGLLREFLLHFQQISRRSLSQIKHAGKLEVNGEEVTVRAPVKEGDTVVVTYPIEEESTYLTPENIPLDIIYEDDFVLLINKPPGLCVHPTYNQSSGTLANAVMYHWKKKGWQRTFHAVNRLDRDTSGIVLIAQNRYSHQQLSQQQKDKTLVRRYDAFVHGCLNQETGVIEAPIARAKDSLIEREVNAEGQYARTEYEVRQYNEAAGYTWVKVQLKTGRTHQIRVHFAYIGHPLLGDDLYGGTQSLIGRQALHAYYTSFQHPHTGEHMAFEAPLPHDLGRLV
ncbi:RluA family pseudouridine synthase [Caldalkalibacillus salinus]|uniref:RluA family pseudouridine synthase n=1 Tax=Caldalkalibacillus salinus TaxID=2803787 RepID=UPI0019218C4A|nr:RluA family pseudouridine synthase [Caldalkalibacillus salinus]